jgi:hypothetical protein
LYVLADGELLGLLVVYSQVEGGRTQTGDLRLRPDRLVPVAHWKRVR